MISLQTGFRHPVTHILFSPDGSAVAVAQPHSGITVLDRATGRTLAVCPMPRHAALTGLTFCGGGRLLAAASAKGIVVFDANTGARVLTNPSYPKPRILADRGDAVLGAALAKPPAVRAELWVSASGVSERYVKPVFYRNHFVVTGLSPAGTFVVGTERGEHALRSTDGTTLAARIARPTDEPSERYAVTFCPLGRRFAINDGRTLDVYDTAGLADEGEGDHPTANPLVQRVNGIGPIPMPHIVLAPTFTLTPDKPRPQNDWFPPFALAADGRGLLVKRPRNRIQWWDAPTATLTNEWSWRFEWVTCVAVSTDGQTGVAGGRFGRVLLWDLE